MPVPGALPCWPCQERIKELGPFPPQLLTYQAWRGIPELGLALKSMLESTFMKVRKCRTDETAWLRAPMPPRSETSPSSPGPAPSQPARPASSCPPPLPAPPGRGGGH